MEFMETGDMIAYVENLKELTKHSGTNKRSLSER
jgi:hypothetical protein